MQIFSTNLISGSSDGPMMHHCMDTTRSSEIRANAIFWFEFELRQYTSSSLNLTALASEKKKFIPVAGTDSAEPGIGPISVIAEMLGLEVMRISGGHVGHMTVPKEFADSLLEILR